MKPGLIHLTIALALMFAWSSTIIALTQIERPFSQLVGLADVILVGTVSGSSAEWGQGQLANTIFTVATLDDLDVIKGDVQGATVELRYAGGRIGDLIYSYEGMPRLTVGTRYVLFISNDTSALFPVVGIGQGMFMVVQGGGGSTETIQTVGGHDVLGILGDHIRTTGPGEPVTPDQFAFCIENLMMGIAPELCPVEPAPQSQSGSLHPLDCSDHPSALVCYKFADDQSVNAVWRDPGTACVPDATYDTAEKAGRLVIGTKCHANSSGDFRFHWPRQTDQIWIQFRYKPQQELITEPDAYNLPHYKIMETWEGSSPCASSQFVEQNTYHRGYPQWYEACGSGDIWTSFANGDFDLQPGGDTACHYQPPTERPLEKCLFYEGNWATISYHMDLNGSEHGGQRWVDGWIQYDGEPRVHVLSFPLGFTSALEHAHFSPYMTGKDPSIDHPIWSVWYQDILVTTTPLFE